MENKTHLTFDKESSTSIKVLYDGKHVGNIWSATEEGSMPYGSPRTGGESIQVCGFARASEVWACGIFHGTKDTVLKFNPMMNEFYKRYHKEYKEYVDECFKQNKPQMIKSFGDWVDHMGYPDASKIRSDGRKAQSGHNASEVRK